MSAKMDEIYETVLPEMAANQIPDTLENRLDFLSGIRDAWLEEPSVSFEKWLYVQAIGNEIYRLHKEIAKK